MKYLSVNKQKAVDFDNFTYLIKDGYIQGSRNLTTHTLKVLLLEALVASLMFFEALPIVLSNNEKTVLSENGLTSRVLYLNDSWNDAPKDLRKPSYDFAEIRKIEVEADAVIITANATLRGWYSYPASIRPNYIIFFDTDLDGASDISWRYQKIEWANYSMLYRFKDDKLYYNGTWHKYSTYAPNFEGVIAENETTGETAFYMGGVINGTVRLKVASMVDYTRSYVTYWEGDLAPGSNFTDATKIGKYFGPAYKNACDTVFPYSNDTATLAAGEPPPQPPPPPPEIQLNPLLQLIVWGMQATVWITVGIVNLPFWFRDNAVYGSLIMAVVLFSSYSLVKKWRTNRHRLKGMLDSAE